MGSRARRAGKRQGGGGASVILVDKACRHSNDVESSKYLCIHHQLRARKVRTEGLWAGRRRGVGAITCGCEASTRVRGHVAARS
eukprot:794786-Prymnesium_polylepis.1